MPQTITTAQGETLEILTEDDLGAFEDRLGAKLFRWLMTGGGVAILGIVAGAVRFEARLAAVEASDQKGDAQQVAEAAEIRHLARKVDSLTIVLANQTELLRELNRRVR